jgi:DNA/RNA endonuclease YhcR with UshA esterase domain
MPETVYSQRLSERVPMALLRELHIDQTIPMRRGARIIFRLFFFVVVGCTNLASAVVTRAQPSPASIIHGVWLAMGGVADAQGPTGGTGGVAPQPTLTPLANVTNSMTNREITVQATIANVRAPSPGKTNTPYIVTLTQEGATSSLVFWEDIQPPLTKLKEGNLIRANVKVNEYRGRLQLRLEKAANLEVVSTAGATSTEPAKIATGPSAILPSATPSPTTTRARTVIGAIKADWIDRIVSISGTIAASDSLGNGQRIHIQDGTGEIQVLLWENVLGGLAANELQPGRVITVTGPVCRYRGLIELVPEAAVDVKLGRQ